MSMCSQTLLLAVLAITTLALPHRDMSSGCTTQPVVVGMEGFMTFHFRPDLNMESDTFIAYVIRTNHTANVVQCDRKREAAITCDVINRAFQPTGIEDYRLTLATPRATGELAGTYTLWTLVNGAREYPVVCRFVVTTDTQGTSDEQNNVTVITIVVVVVVVIVVLAAVAAGVLIWFFKLRKRPAETTGSPRDQVDEGKSSHPQASGEFAMPLLPHKDENMRWYFEQIPEDEETELLHFWRNESGSFLITHDHSTVDCLIFAVLFEGVIKHYRIKTTESGFEFEGQPFATLSELVDYYMKHDIEVEGKSCGKLTKPFQLKPNQEWYFGRMGRQASKRLLRSPANGDGCFLIRDSVTKPSCYTLAVHLHSRTYSYLIEVEEDGFTLSDAGTKFQTLSALVDFYMLNDIQIGNKIVGKLVRPATGQTRCSCV